MDHIHVDVLIVGAGLSGIGLACHLSRKCPNKRYLILESRESMGGTWDLFRYPGIRSDSDMTTMGYEFKPWQGEKDIASGESILQYIKDTAAEYEVDQHIRYGHAVSSATWSSDQATWTVRANTTSTAHDTPQSVEYQCSMLLMCAGYYDYQRGSTPDFPGRDQFVGPIIHPQHWPQDLDYAGKKIIVIGSGATAVTLVPNLAKSAKHVVMLQRSPTYMLVRPEISPLRKFLSRFLPSNVSHSISRRWNIILAGWLYRKTRTKPHKVRKYLLNVVRKRLGPDYDVARHFTPRYNPWDQRLCVVPDGDLFKAINNGTASVVTDEIEQLTSTGIRLNSGEELEADMIVTATGLRLKMQGGIEFRVDDQQLDFSKTITYKGLMNSDVPNLITTFGYINTSWTLRSDLIADFACRVINHMDERKHRRCTPRLRTTDRNMQTRPFIHDFSANYIQRSLDRLPKQGDCEPWINCQDYQRELKTIGSSPLEDGCLIFER